MPDRPANSPGDAAVRVLTTLRDGGHTAYLAGGCVRDRLLGLEPTDYDVATDATPDVVQQLFPRSNAVGAAFGVVLVYHGRGNERVTTEVATFRADGAYSDGRRPDAVTFTDAEHDARRRDFTVNGLFEDPALGPHASAGGSSKILDFVNGRADLEAGIIRAIGNPEQRFAEDYLRMLRAVRFAARFGFALDPNTAAAIQRHAPKLADIARERIGDEVRRMLMGPRPAEAVGMLHDLGLDAAVFGAAADTVPLDAVARLDAAADYATRLYVWLHGRRPRVRAHDARAALVLSGDEAAHLGRLAELCDQAPDLRAARVADRKTFFAHPLWPQARLAMRAVAAAPDATAALDADRDQLAHDGIGLTPEPLLTGDDLIAAGFSPGPAFKRILDAVYDAQLEGRVTTGRQALELAKQVQP